MKIADALAQLPDDTPISITIGSGELTIGQIREALERVSVREALAFQREQADPEPTILPDRLYTVREVADILRVPSAKDKTRTNAVYAIPAHELRRTPTGPNGGRVCFQGRHIAAYIESRGGGH